MLGQNPDQPRAASPGRRPRGRGPARRFLSTIQLERQDFNGQVLTIRAQDLRVIGATFGLGIDDMLEKLRSLGVLFKG